MRLLLLTTFAFGLGLSAVAAQDDARGYRLPGNADIPIARGPEAAPAPSMTNSELRERGVLPTVPPPPQVIVIDRGRSVYRGGYRYRFGHRPHRPNRPGLRPRGKVIASPVRPRPPIAGPGPGSGSVSGVFGARVGNGGFRIRF